MLPSKWHFFREKRNNDKLSNMINDWLRNDVKIMTSEQSDTKTLPQSSVHIGDVNVKVLIVAINMAEIISVY